MIDGGSRVRRDFFEAVQKMEPEDALMLDVVRRSTAVRAAGNSIEVDPAEWTTGVGT
jgi:hypothetical protein